MSVNNYNPVTCVTLSAYNPEISVDLRITSKNLNSRSVTLEQQVMDKKKDYEYDNFMNYNSTYKAYEERPLDLRVPAKRNQSLNLVNVTGTSIFTQVPVSIPTSLSVAPLAVQPPPRHSHTTVVTTPWPITLLVSLPQASPMSFDAGTRHQEMAPSPFKKITSLLVRPLEVDGEKELLPQRIPSLCKDFNLLYKIGIGTFSSVYLATKKSEDQITRNKLMAVKLLVPTSLPKRIMTEIWCMKNLGGKDNIVPLYSGYRDGEYVALVMPFITAPKFSEYYLQMSPLDVQMYMKNLLVALSRVHSYGVIHRDIKPSNFLYDPINKQYMLIDFGLAERKVDAMEENGTDVKIDSSSMEPLKSKRVTDSGKKDVLHRRTPLVSCVSKMNAIAKANRELARKIRGNPELQLTPISKPKTSSRTSTPSTTTNDSGIESDICSCHKLPQVCSKCCKKPQQVAARAGTAGFRPPEVLLKYVEQTTAVDIWATGVILLSILSGRYPFFQAPDDAAAFLEITTLFGINVMKQVALSLGKVLTTSMYRPAMNIRKLCQVLRKNNTVRNQPHFGKTNICSDCKQDLDQNECLCVSEDKTVYSDKWKVKRKFTQTNPSEFPECVYDLLGKLLDPQPNSRITAKAALEHPYFTGKY